MLNIVCNKCGKDLNEKGCLVFSPPKELTCEKYHICISCWIILLDWIINDQI